MAKLIRFDIQGDFQLGFSVTAQITEDTPPFGLIVGETASLPPHPNIKEKYRSWQIHYRNIVSSIQTFSLTPRPSLTNISANIQENDFEPFNRETQELLKEFNTWLKHEQFQPIESLLRSVTSGEENRILLLTNDPWLRKLPWHDWDLLKEKDFAKTEVGFGSPRFKQSEKLSSVFTGNVKILAILGYQADIESQGQALQNLGDNVQVTWLKEPKREELDEPLWKQQWDILFFVGHGESQDDWTTGTIRINENDKITVSELRNHLRKAIENGLKLVILNCCDGLGLAHSLAEGEGLYLPQIIVMREELPVPIAPKFLEYFLDEFTQGNSFYVALRKSRERLRLLDKQFPCASALPIACQNPTIRPLRWSDLVIPICPYRGLLAFQEEDTEIFFGREAFTKHLVRIIADKKLVAVIGASGSGKSSVVLAGLIPQLRQKEHWLIVSLRPGVNPFENLGKVMSLSDDLVCGLQQGNTKLSEVINNINQGRTFLLVVDQFEEIYSYPNQKFLDALLETLQNVSAFRLVITLRADFIGQAIEYSPFREQLQFWKPEFIGNMNRVELRLAIEEPAKTRGVSLETELTEHILNDIGEEPGYLPLLEFALTEMWDKQIKGCLTRQVYDNIGGVKNALRQHAQKVYDRLSQEDKEKTKRIFLQLVSPSDGTEYTRRLAILSEIGEENRDLVTRLATARLVVSSRNENTQVETVEIVHEALIKAWPDLRKWIDEDDTFLRWKKRLQVALGEWEKNQKKEGYLLQGAPLGEAEGYLHQRLEDITVGERQFIQLGLKTRDRNRRRTILGLTCFSVFALILSGVAGLGWYRVEQRQRVSEIERLSDTASNKYTSRVDQIEVALSIMKAGRDLKAIIRNSQSLKNYPTLKPLLLLQLFIDNLNERNQFVVDGELNSVSFSPDGKIIASLEDNGLIKLWELSGKLITQWQKEYKYSKSRTVFSAQIKFSPDGKRLATTDIQKVRLWNLSGKELAQLEHPTLMAVDFSHDGKLIATVGGSGSIKIWDSSGKQLVEFNYNNTDVFGNHITFSPNSQIVGYAGNGQVQLWDLSGKPIAQWKTNQASNFLSFSPDGKQVATTGGEIVELWDLSGKKLSQFKDDEMGSSFNSVIFSPNGKLIAAASEEGSVLITNRSGKLIYTMNRHLGEIYDLSFSQDGRYITTGGADGTVRLWDLSDKFHAQLDGHSGEVNSIDFSPDGRLIATSGKDGTIRLWNLSGEQIAQWFAHEANVFHVSFSPDGQHLASKAGDDTIRLWDLSGKLQIQWKVGDSSVAIEDSEDFVGIGVHLSVNKPTNILTVVDIIKNSPAQKEGLKAGDHILAIDGKSTSGMDIKEATTLIRGKLNTTVSLLISRNGKNSTLSVNRSKITLLSEKTRKIPSFNLSFSPDGQRIVTGAGSGIRIWDLSGKQLAEIEVPQKLQDKVKYSEVRFSPDGRQLISWSMVGGQVQLWDLSGNQITQLNVRDKVMDVGFSPDGKYIITGGDNGTVRLWNLSGQQIAQLNGHTGTVNSVAFSPDNQRIGTAGNDDTVRLWSLSGQLIALFYSGENLNSLSFSPDGKYVAAAGSNGKALVWRVENLDELLTRGCNWWSDYLKNNPNVSDSDRHLCDGISKD